MPRGRTQGGSQSAVTTTETVVATLAGISVPAGDNIDLEGYVDITAGTGATAVNVRIRRGMDATGATVGQVVQATLAAGSRGVVAVNASDAFSADVANQQYVITVQQIGATGNGSINSGYIGGIW